MKTKKAIYAGSFDPVTLGHLNVVQQAMQTFDELHIGIGKNASKSGLFTMEERLEILNETLEEEIFYPIRHGRYEEEACKISTGIFEGSLAKYAREIGCTHMVRGLRQVSDFNDEFALNGAMQRIAPDIKMVYIICDAKFLHVSSSTAREIFRLGEYGTWLVGNAAGGALKDKFRADPKTA